MERTGLYLYCWCCSQEFSVFIKCSAFFGSNSWNPSNQIVWPVSAQHKLMFTHLCVGLRCHYWRRWCYSELGGRLILLWIRVHVTSNWFLNYIWSNVSGVHFSIWLMVASSKLICQETNQMYWYTWKYKPHARLRRRHDHGGKGWTYVEIVCWSSTISGRRSFSKILLRCTIVPRETGGAVDHPGKRQTDARCVVFFCSSLSIDNSSNTMKQTTIHFSTYLLSMFTNVYKINIGMSFIRLYRCLQMYRK
jgi:hypothetical protein